MSEHDTEGWQTTPIFRDLDYGWDTAMENLLDPSHVPIAHHKVLSTRDQAQPVLMDVKVTDKGCTAKWGLVGRPSQDLTFEAPNRDTYVFSIGGKMLLTTTSYVTPMGITSIFNLLFILLLSVVHAA